MKNTTLKILSVCALMSLSFALVAGTSYGQSKSKGQKSSNASRGSKTLGSKGGGMRNRMLRVDKSRLSRSGTQSRGSTGSSKRQDRSRSSRTTHKRVMDDPRYRGNKGNRMSQFLNRNKQEVPKRSTPKTKNKRLLGNKKKQTPKRNSPSGKNKWSLGNKKKQTPKQNGPSGKNKWWLGNKKKQTPKEKGPNGKGGRLGSINPELLKPRPKPEIVDLKIPERQKIERVIPMPTPRPDRHGDRCEDERRGSDEDRHGGRGGRDRGDRCEDDRRGGDRDRGGRGRRDDRDHCDERGRGRGHIDIGIGIGIGGGCDPRPSCGAPCGCTGGFHAHLGGFAIGGCTHGSVWIEPVTRIVETQVWVEGETVEVWVEDVVGVYTDSCGNQHQILVAAAGWRTITLPGHFETRKQVQIVTAGYWRSF